MCAAYALTMATALRFYYQRQSETDRLPAEVMDRLRPKGQYMYAAQSRIIATIIDDVLNMQHIRGAPEIIARINGL